MDKAGPEENCPGCQDRSVDRFRYRFRQRLIQAGVPAGALRIAIAWTAAGEGHAVLIVRTTSGDLVLDNLTGQIKPWHAVNYRWIAMSSADPRRWNKIG